MKIIQVYAYEVLNSIGFPTIACVIKTDTGAIGKAIVPININYNDVFCVNVYDKDSTRYEGRGINKAITLINKNISNMVRGLSITNQQQIDKLLVLIDGSLRKTYYGAMALLVVSMAVAKTAANEMHLPLYRYIREYLLGNKKNTYLLPVPIVSIFNIRHAVNEIERDFLQIAVYPFNVTSFAQAMEKINSLFYGVKKALEAKNIEYFIDNNGAFEFKMPSIQEAIDFLIKIIKQLNFTIDLESETADFLVSVNFSSNSYYDKLKKVYNFPIPILNNNEFQNITSDMLMWQIIDLVKLFPIINVEEPFSYESEKAYQELVEKVKNYVQVSSDQLFSSNPYLVKLGIKNRLANALIIKLDEIGTLSETIEAILYAKQLNWAVIVGSSSYGTEDSFIADLAVALGTGQIQVGGFNHSEIIAKYNRLLEIELELQQNGLYENQKIFYNLKTKEDE